MHLTDISRGVITQAPAWMGDHQIQISITKMYTFQNHVTEMSSQHAFSLFQNVGYVIIAVFKRTHWLLASLDGFTSS